jgi:hypothetical protein
MPAKATLEAFELFLLGRHYLRTREPEDLARAVSMYETAMVHDTSYAPAYAGLAEAYLLEAEYGDLTLDQAVELAEPMINEALTLDETGDIGLDYVQGYLLGRPQALEQDLDETGSVPE